MNHSLPSISFASGGDEVSAHPCPVAFGFNFQPLTKVTANFIGYVAKDPIHERGLGLGTGVICCPDVCCYCFQHAMCLSVKTVRLFSQQLVKHLSFAIKCTCKPLRTG